jgi:hypothetical protein
MCEGACCRIEVSQKGANDYYVKDKDDMQSLIITSAPYQNSLCSILNEEQSLHSINSQFYENHA